MVILLRESVAAVISLHVFFSFSFLFCRADGSSAASLPLSFLLRLFLEYYIDDYGYPVTILPYYTIYFFAVSLAIFLIGCLEVAKQIVGDGIPMQLINSFEFVNISHSPFNHNVFVTFIQATIRTGN